MKRLLFWFLLMGILPYSLLAQNPDGNYNPYVNQGIISPSPLWPVEYEGKGEISFNVGNTGDDVLVVSQGEEIVLEIVLSNGVPDNADPLVAVSGSARDWFEWTYENGVYTATQTENIGAKAHGNISILYRVSQNSSLPGFNGFRVSLTPAPYQQGSNSINDDVVSSYTFTEIRDYGDAPSSYGVAFQVIDNLSFLGAVVDGEYINQASAWADGDDNEGADDEDGVVFPSGITQGETIQVAVSVEGAGNLNAWIDWNGDGDFLDSDEWVTENLLRTQGTEFLSIGVPANARISSSVFARFRLSATPVSLPYGSGGKGEVEDYIINILPSDQAPSIPTGLQVVSVSESGVSLSWDASSDDNEVAGYRIYRNGTFVAQINSLYYTDATVVTGQDYEYAVSAYDLDGFESARCSPVSVHIEDLLPPTVPEGLKIVFADAESVTIGWHVSNDNVGIKNYRIYRNGFFLAETNWTTYTDNSFSGESAYYAVSASDHSGNESAISDSIVVDFGDREPPSRPTGLMVVPVSMFEVKLTWNAATDNVAVTGYKIYRSGELVAEVEVLEYNDSGLELGNNYFYSISAVDAMGNESQPSRTMTIFMTDLEAPTIPQDVRLVSAHKWKIDIAWNASSDNDTVDSYKIYRDDEYIANSPDLKFSDQTVEEGYTYSYKVAAVDRSGNESDPSEELNVLATMLDEKSHSSIKLYPNPSDGKFYLDPGHLTQEFRLEIYSSQGSRVLSRTLNGDNEAIELDLENYPPGVYLLKLVDGRAVLFSKRLILN